MRHRPQSKGRRAATAAAALTALALIITSCGGETATEPVDSGEEAAEETAAPEAEAEDGPSRLTVAMTADLLTLYPINETVVGTDVFGHIFDALVAISGDGSLEPRLATSWSTEDSLVWTFEIHPDAMWHDGTPVTADDVAYTFNLVAGDDTLATHGYVRMLEVAEAVGPTTVEFTLKTPVAVFDRWASLISILQEGTADRTTPEDFTQNPIGSGPYRFVSLTGSERLLLAVNEDYHLGRSPIDEIEFVSVPSESARLAGLRTGELDVISGVPVAEVANLQNEDGVRVVAAPNNRIQYLGMNPNNAPLDDLRVRQAINLAIDRTALTQQALEGLGDPAGQPVAPVTFGYSDDPKFAPPAYDPDAARALLAEAGYDGSTPVNVVYPTSSLPFAASTAEIVAGYLTAVGIPVQLEPVEWGTLIQRWRATDFPNIHLFGYGPSILDANLIINSLYQSGSRGYFFTEEMDRLAVEQAAEADPAARLALIERIWEIDQENMLHAWMFNEYDAYAVSDRVEWTPRPTRRMYFWDASIVG